MITCSTVCWFLTLLGCRASSTCSARWAGCCWAGRCWEGCCWAGRWVGAWVGRTSLNVCRVVSVRLRLISVFEVLRGTFNNFARMTVIMWNFDKKPEISVLLHHHHYYHNHHYYHVGLTNSLVFLSWPLLGFSTRMDRGAVEWDTEMQNFRRKKRKASHWSAKFLGKKKNKKTLKRKIKKSEALKKKPNRFKTEMQVCRKGLQYKMETKWMEGFHNFWSLVPVVGGRIFNDE